MNLNERIQALQDKRQTQARAVMKWELERDKAAEELAQIETELDEAGLSADPEELREELSRLKSALETEVSALEVLL